MAEKKAKQAAKVKKAKNFCFGCGADNPDGMHLKFALDDTGKQFFLRFRLGRRFTGPPGHLHGGIIATILDEGMGKLQRLRAVTAMTREMTIEYLKPTPLNQWLLAVCWEDRVRGRVHFNLGEIRDEQGVVLARSRGTFIAIDPQKMFGRQMTSAARHVALLPPPVAKRTKAAPPARAKTSGAK